MKTNKARTLLAGAAASMAVAAGGAGCGTSSEPVQQTPAMSVPAQSRPAMARSRAPNAANGAMSSPEAFLARIKNASRTNGVIVNARMNGSDELGVVFGQRVKLRDIQPVMTTLMREMRDAFPGRAWTIRGYAPNNKEMAVMRYNPSLPANRNTTFQTAPGLR